MWWCLCQHGDMPLHLCGWRELSFCDMYNLGSLCRDVHSPGFLEMAAATHMLRDTSSCSALVSQGQRACVVLGAHPSPWTWCFGQALPAIVDEGLCALP